ncbi:MAG TPA: EVE domain-containing protein [Thermoanaerobaculia bacterium]|nr:EVE domain-containing protein [Thermoanaerobaculia bacterium]
MSHFLLKTEPGSYSFSDLEREGGTVWDGVRNNLALSHMREIEKDDEVIIYHSGREASAIGIARVSRGAYRDPSSSEERIVVFDVEPVQRLPRPVSLKELKSDPAFKGSDLARLPRLSVVPLTKAQWRKILSLARN